MAEPPEGSAESVVDTVDAFAADLRRLRLESDSPTLNRLAHDSGVSRSVLSDAFAGRALPSARTVSGIVRACGADAGPWLARRDRLAEARRGELEATPPEAARRRRGLPTWAWAAAAAFVVGVLAGAGLAVALVPHPGPSDAAAPLVDVETGQDPGRTACIDDADVVTRRVGPENALLEIIWSDACQAAWARITRYDGRDQGNTVTAAIYPETSPNGDLRQEATEHDVNSGYTFLVVRPTPETLLCADGSFTTDGESFDVGHVCT